MRLLRSFPIIVIALVLLAIIGLCSAQGSVMLLLVAGSLAMMSWYVTEGPRGRTLPKWVSNLLVVAVAISVVVDLLVPPSDVLEVLGRFSVWLTLIKLYERRTARDHAHLMGLSLLLMLVGCLQTQDLLFGFVLVVYAGLGIYALLLHQLYAAHERDARDRRAARPGGGDDLVALTGRRPTIGRHLLGHFRVLAVGIASAGVVLSAGLFLVFPRSLGHGVIASRFRAAGNERAPGFDDRIDLDGGTRITDSRRPVFEVRQLNPAGRPIRTTEPLYLRGAVLDVYRNGRWTASADPVRTLRPGGVAGDPTVGANMVPVATGVTRSGPLVRLEFTFRSPAPGLFSLYAPLRVATGAAAELSYVPATQILRDANVPLWSYVVESCPRPSDELVRGLGGRRGPDPSRPLSFSNLRDPDVARIHALAASVLEGAGLPAAPPAAPARWRWQGAAARALAAHLRAPPYEYTIDVSDVVRGDEDPIIDFLFSSRRGHCEFFASALTAMCHAVGIEARVVTGFLATEYDPVDDRYVVLASGAHAWVEVRTGPYRFTTVDPTPPGALAAPTVRPRSLAERLGGVYRTIEGLWASRIVQFDDRAQSRMLDMVDAAWSERFRALRDAAARWVQRVNRFFNLGPAGYIWLGIVGLALGIAVVAIVTMTHRYRMIWRTLRLHRLRRGDARGLLRRLGFYYDMLTLLRQAGCPKPDWQPPLAYAEHLASSRPEAGALVGAITESYYRARYAREPLSGAELHETRRRLDRLATALKD